MGTSAMGTHRELRRVVDQLVHFLPKERESKEKRKMSSTLGDLLKSKVLPSNVIPNHAPFNQPESLYLVGTCGDGKKPITDTTQLDAFIKDGGGFVVGKTTTAGIHTIFGEVAPEVLGPFEYYWREVDRYCWRPDSRDTREVFTTSTTCCQIWWFSSKHQTKLINRLQDNPHFPVEEAEFVPKCAVMDVALAGGHFHNGGSTLLEKVTWGTSSELQGYCDHVPPALRNVRLVVVEANQEKCSDIVDGLCSVFAADENGAAHTVVLEGASTELATAVVEAKMKYIKRLVLEDCPDVDFAQLLPHVVENNELSEIVFKASGSMNGQVLKLAQQCSHVSFNTSCDLSESPPTCVLPCVPLAETLPLRLTEFNELCHTCGKDAAPVGLLTAYGQVVPLARNLVPRFHLLKDMLDNAKDENVVPMELEPPVGKESIALAVHFVTHYLPEAVDTECEKAEAKRGPYSTSANPSFSWCPAFAQFRKLHIQEQYPSSKRRVQVMCELMALAAYLNCPSLKRFLRAALIMEEQEEGESEGTPSPMGRGKRDRE